jgi:iron(III) transport system substrate-binding protein
MFFTKKSLWLAKVAIALAAGIATSMPALSQPSGVLNLYSARHYQTDEALYAEFTQQTGIKINRIEADDNALFERLRSEGKNSPADVILMVDAARLWRAQVEGLFQPIQSKILESRIPKNLRSNDEGQGSQWFGFSTRARMIIFNKATVRSSDVDTYEKLADPMNKGKVCTRSGSHPYMLSMIGAMYERSGEAKTEAWAKSMVSNMARSP